MNDLIRLRDASGQFRLIPAAPERTLSEVLFLGGLWPRRPFCAGLGRCGLCAVRFETVAPEALAEEREALSPARLNQGWRLACRRDALPGLAISLPFVFPGAEAQSRTTDLCRKPQGPLSLAVDLGTTSLHWRLDDDAGIVDQGQELNPQLPVGSEVMSRLGFALQAAENARALQDVVLQRLEALAAAWPVAVERMCVAGNSVMTALLLGWPLEGLAAAPYALPHAGGFWARLLHPGPEAYIPPLPAPFIGADLSAGMAHIHFSERDTPRYPFLLADLGTNGEFILALGPNNCLGASVPMGPALEGIGMSHGSAALPGVWVDFSLGAGGVTPLVLPGNASDDLLAEPRISGTGYLALLARLHGLGLLDASGRFAPGNSPLARRIGKTLEDGAAGRRLPLGRGVYLTGRDVEELLKVKAAFNLAFSRLLAEAGLLPGELKAVYLAGALGEHVHLDALEELGFVPLGMKSRILALGNTSLAGAALLARSRQAREWIEDVMPRMRTLAIGQEQNFLTQYVQRLVFAYVP
jgi:uncharacterized 2Fe-2S/4Fe-4S cluster protein (DUF4445 family)/ferredoxin